MERRNPYLILGLPFGASRDEAQRAFARRKRQVRGDAAAQTDLTWALHEIDEVLREAQSELAPYRMPADPDAFSVSGTGVFAPPPESAGFSDREVQDALRELRAAAAREYLQVLVQQRSRQIRPLPPEDR